MNKQLEKLSPTKECDLFLFKLGSFPDSLIPACVHKRNRLVSLSSNCLSHAGIDRQLIRKLKEFQGENIDSQQKTFMLATSYHSIYNPKVSLNNLIHLW